MPPTVIQLFIGFTLSLLIGWIAYRRRSLNRSGVLGAVIVGATTFGLGGLSWAMVVVAFFVTSSWLTHYRIDQKREAAAEFAKAGGSRDFAQVMANGGAAVLLAIAGAFWAPFASLTFAAFIGAMATATADTWATELGLLSREKPRLITTWQETRAGENGAVSALGLTAAATGALFIGSVALLGSFVEGLFGDAMVRAPTWMPTTALIAGWLGSVVDSLLGATLQAAYYCAPDDKYTEKPVHSCGRPAIHVRGLGWMNNDAVNFLSSVAGAVTAVLVYIGIR